MSDANSKNFPFTQTKCCMQCEAFQTCTTMLMAFRKVLHLSKEEKDEVRDRVRLDDGSIESNCA